MKHSFWFWTVYYIFWGLVGYGVAWLINHISKKRKRKAE